MRTAARYFDGIDARQHTVTASTDGVLLHIERNGESATFELANVTISAPVGQGDWALDLPGGGRLLVANAEFVAQLNHNEAGWVRRLEASWRWALAAVVIAVVGGYAALTYGLPAAARHVAFAVPQNLDARMSTDSLGAMDRLLFEDSELTPARHAELQTLFKRVTALDARYDEYSLVFRKSPKIGANAFALPGGMVVMTDEMVELAEADDELLAVLAHEVGHQANRHLLRIVLQNSAGALLIASLTGDLTSISALAASVPTVLMQAKYSRDFEREADAFAFEFLKSEGKNPDVLRELLLRLEDRAGSRIDGGPASWFSSHPRSAERLPE
ncbi:MAG: M48 family metallopeptidase [Woeseia sp.]